MMRDYNCPTLNDLVEYGLCADLATVIQEKFPDVKIHSWDGPIHTWVEFEGYHFDMESPEGVKNWREMEYFKDCPQRLLEGELV